MTNYNYHEAVLQDAYNYIKDNYTADELREMFAQNDFDTIRDDMENKMWDADSVTGNGSGSYTFNRDKAREYVYANIDTVKTALYEFGCFNDPEALVEKFLEEEYEYFDVTARCYCLYGAVEEALKRIYSEVCGND